MKIYKVLICGDRRVFPRYARIVVLEIKRLKKEYGNRLLLIEGGAPGVDDLVKQAGHALDVHVAEIEALWNTRGRAAGPQRNKIMAALDPDEVIAIHFNISQSKGTAGMIDIAKRRGIPYRLIDK